MKWIVSFCALLIALIGFKLYQNYQQKQVRAQTVLQMQAECGASAFEAGAQKLSALTKRWDDAQALASSTSRIALSGPVSNMQGIKRDVEAVQLPACLLPAKGALSASMSSTIQGFMSFMTQDSSGSSNSLAAARVDAEKYLAELAIAQERSVEVKKKIQELQR